MDAKNVWSGIGAICSDIDIVDMTKGKIVKFRIAIGFAADDKSSDDRSGYFDVVYFARGETPNSTFVLDQVAKGNFKKGSELAIVGSLRHQRWRQDDQPRQKVVIQADVLDYAARARRDEPEGTAKTAATSSDADAFPSTF